MELGHAKNLNSTLIQTQPPCLHLNFEWHGNHKHQHLFHMEYRLWFHGIAQHKREATTCGVGISHHPSMQAGGWELERGGGRHRRQALV